MEYYNWNLGRLAWEDMMKKKFPETVKTVKVIPCMYISNDSETLYIWTSYKMAQQLEKKWSKK